LISLANFTGERSGLARNVTAIGLYAGDQFTIPDSVYESTGGTNYPTSPIPIELVSLHSVPGTGQMPLPEPGTGATVDSFFDVFTELSYIGHGNGRARLDGIAVAYRIENVTPPGTSTSMFETQMLSIFDVFTELSIDGGQTFHPGGVMRLELDRIVPEPTTLALAMLGAIGCGLRARRRR
jgi:hypothetical protein